MSRLLRRRRVLQPIRQHSEVLPTGYRAVEWVGCDEQSVSSAVGPMIITDIAEGRLRNLSGYEIHISFSVSKPARAAGNQATGCVMLAMSPLAGGYLCSTKNGRVGLSLEERDDTCFQESINCEDSHAYKIWWDNSGMKCECENYLVSREYSSSDEQQELSIGRGSHSSYMPRWFVIYGNIQVYYDGELVAKYCPCYNVSSGEIGFYDTVGDVFYNNIGTVPFTRGADK